MVWLYGGGYVFGKSEHSSPLMGGKEAHHALPQVKRTTLYTTLPVLCPKLDLMVAMA